MNNTRTSHLHPIERVGALESKFRLLVQNPKRILRKYITSGMTVLDLGCGSGYFTIEIAKLLDGSGKVIASDVQDDMLNILRQKLNNSEHRKQIQIHKSHENSLCLSDKVDFVFAFYSFHEMKYIDNIISELKTLMKTNAKILISEQKFHVSKPMFKAIVDKMINNGFVICHQPYFFLSRSVVLKLK